LAYILGAGLAGAFFLAAGAFLLAGGFVVFLAGFFRVLAAGAFFFTPAMMPRTSTE